MKETKLFNKSFTIMSIGQFISLFGNSLQRFALSLLILDLTGSAVIFSIITAVTFLPQILLSPFGGAIADRFSKKWIMVILDTISGFLLLGFYFYFQTTPSISYFVIGVLMFVLTMIQSVYDPSVRASIPAITTKENLSQANSVVSIISSITGLLGPIAAGFLYGIYGIQVILLINTCSFLLSAFMELFLSIPFTKIKISGNILFTFCSDIKNTCIYLLRENPIILKTILFSASVNLFLAPIYSVGMPYMEKIIFRVSNQLYGISEALVGAGMIIGALFASFIGRKLPFTKLYYYFYILTFLVLLMGSCSLPFIMTGTGVSYCSFILFTIYGFLFSCTLAIINILCMTYLQKVIPMEYMGKSMALIMTLSSALYPVGQLIFGVLYDIFSKTTWTIYIIVALCSLIVTILMRHVMIQTFGKK